MENTKKFIKPVCALIGTDGNVFSLAGKVQRCLRRAGYPEKAKEFIDKLYACPSYDAALALMSDYVEID